jgi:hypothetical protein
MASSESPAPTRSALAYAHRTLDRLAPPATRQKAYDDVAAFANARPVLFAFLLAQLLFAVLPAVLFTTFVVSTTATAFAAAAVFSLFWAALAFAVLVPALLLAALGGLLVWAWLVAAFLAARWVYLRVPSAAGAGAKDDAPRHGSQVSWAHVAAVKDEQETPGPVTYQLKDDASADGSAPTAIVNGQ